MEKITVHMPEALHLPDGRVLAYFRRIWPEGMNFWALISREEYERLEEVQSWANWPNLPDVPADFPLCFGREWGTHYEFRQLLEAAGYAVQDVPAPDSVSNAITAWQYARQLLPGSH